jgi:hypothetical protein
MDRKTFPGFSQMTTSEVLVFAKTLKGEGYTTEEALKFMKGIDTCLSIQASASIINSFAGKSKWNKANANQIIFDTALQIPIPERFINNE